MLTSHAENSLLQEFERQESYRSFLKSLSPKKFEKVVWVLAIIRDLPLISNQYLKKLRGTDGIWEARIDAGNDTFRLLRFFDKGNIVVLTNGFSKKT